MCRSPRSQLRSRATGDRRLLASETAFGCRGVLERGAVATGSIVGFAAMAGTFPERVRALDSEWRLFRRSTKLSEIPVRNACRAEALRDVVRGTVEGLSGHRTAHASRLD
jgi:hypothetical protein